MELLAGTSDFFLTVVMEVDRFNEGMWVLVVKVVWVARQMKKGHTGHGSQIGCGVLLSGQSLSHSWGGQCFCI